MNDKNKMGTKPVFPLLMSMAIPPMLSMFIQSMYNIVDSFYVAKISQDAITAVSLAFPLQNLVLSCAVGLGVGLNSCISRSLGAKDEDAVKSSINHGMLLAGIHSVLMILLGLFLTKPFISMFTNNSEVLAMSTSYTMIVICFSFTTIFHIAVEKMFQAIGNMMIPMFLQLFGCVINIILDPIFIFGKFGVPAMGVEGAAIATVIGQISACTVSLITFFVNKQLPKSFKNFKFNTVTCKNIYAVAIPSAIMMALPSVLVSVINGILASISQTAIAVFGLYYKLQTFVYMPTSGLIQGMRGIVGYNYGAKKYDRVKKILIISIGVTSIIMAIGTVLCVFFPETILSVFNADEEMMSIGVGMLKIISLGFIVSTVPLILAGGFEALGKGKHSLIISLLRVILIIPPVSIVLAKMIGLNGVWWSFPIAETVSAVVAIVLFKRVFNKERDIAQ